MIIIIMCFVDRQLVYMYLHISTIVVCAIRTKSSGSSLLGIVSSPPKLIHFVTSVKYRIDEVCHIRPLSVSGSIIYMYKMIEHNVHYNNTTIIVTSHIQLRTKRNGRLLTDTKKKHLNYARLNLPTL